MINLPRDERGMVHALPLVIIVAAVGIIAFLLITSAGPFRAGLFSTLFKKPSSFAATDTIAVSVDVNANVHSISPYIYGTADGSAFQKTMGSTVDRWGGNQVTRYNWEINDSNSGSDWGLCQQAYLGRGAFSNVGYTQGASGIAVKNSVANVKSNGQDFLFTVPNMGWVAKDGNNNTCSSGVPGNDGPAINSIGAISGYDPTNNRNTTSIRSQMKKGSAFTLTPSTADGVVYQDELINYLVSNFGNAQNGGVKFYAFDNEYDLWSGTHRDVHPARVGYDELSSLFNTFSDAVKAVDPTSQVIGPVSWGWTNYWYSPLDAGTDNYATHADRVAHGNVPLLQWLLRQAKAHETVVGHRTLDVLDVHFYPQGGEYGSDDSTSMQALRLRSVRDLWDPTYTDESWIVNTEGGQHPQLIRLLQNWINQEYPGTKIGISEWNWGDDGNINGGLTIADILGVFGREGVYMANYWTTPADQSPGYWAWRMYRNYDGNFSKFGDTSVSASADPTNVDKISVYASKDSATGDLKIMAINKQPTNDENTTFNLANFSSNGTAKVYRYSQADTTKINQLANVTGVGSSFSYDLTPYSVTLFDLPSSGAPTPTPVPVTPTPSPTPVPTEAPFNGPHTFPGTLQAEDFDAGGEGISYHDTDATNNGGQYRPADGVDIENTTDTGGGFDVGWTQTGEWMKYTVNVATAGTYNLGFRVASQGAGGTFHLEVDGTNVTGNMTIPDTTNWQTFTDLTKTGVALSGGSHVLRLVMDSNGSTGYVGNFNYITLTQAATPSPTPLNTATPTPSSTPVSSCQGADIDHNGKVDIFDYNLMVTNFGKTGVGASGGDINGDGVVNIFDYNILVGNFGKTGC